MGEMNMRIASLPAAYTQGITGKQTPGVEKEASSSFADMLQAKVKEVDQFQHKADATMDEGSVKGAEQIHESMIKLEEADLSLKLLVKTRNKAMEAYQEIMRMQF